VLPAWFDGLVERARAADGQPPFSDQALVDARTGRRELITVDESAAALLGDGEAELVVDPDARRRGHGTALLERVIAQSRGELLVWSHGDHPGARALASHFGFEPVRRLLQLRLDLSRWSSSSRPVSTSSTTVLRPFVPGTEEPAWLDLNARAFAFHAEQGSVSQADLDELEREDWFDASAFLVLVDVRDGTERMIGYCWLKIEPGIGELYVVGVDPDRQGEGLGRLLVDAGLDELHRRGIDTAALYVEADNVPAVKLYESVGFTEYTVDIQYRFTGLTQRSS